MIIVDDVDDVDDDEIDEVETDDVVNLERMRHIIEEEDDDNDEVIVRVMLDEIDVNELLLLDIKQIEVVDLVLRRDEPLQPVEITPSIHLQVTEHLLL